MSPEEREVICAALWWQFTRYAAAGAADTAYPREDQVAETLEECHKADWRLHEALRALPDEWEKKTQPPTTPPAGPAS